MNIQERLRPEHYPQMVAHFISQGMSEHEANHQVFSRMGPAERVALIVRLGLTTSTAEHQSSSTRQHPAGGVNHSNVKDASYYERMMDQMIAKGKVRVFGANKVGGRHV